MDRLSKAEDAERHKKSIPLARYGTVKEIADATIYLFSDAANYVNGTTVVVDGGAWRTHAAEPGKGFSYPDFILSGATVTGVKSGLKTSKSKI